MVTIMTNMGVMPRYFFPTKTGRDYEGTPYLDLLNEHGVSWAMQDRPIPTP